MQSQPIFTSLLSTPHRRRICPATLLAPGVLCYRRRPWTPSRARRVRLVSRGRPLRRKELAIEIVEAEIRSAQYEILLEAAKLVLSGEPIEIARELRDRAERTIRPKPDRH